MWVPGHSGIIGNELTDYNAKQGVAVGKALSLPSIATPAGIRHYFRITRKIKQVSEWDRNALGGLTYICADRGPFLQWLHQIGRKDMDKCQCEPQTIQNAAHVLKCKLIGDGKGRTLEQAEEDLEFCTQVFEFLQAQQ